MNNKLLKENAVLIYYITNFIEQMERHKKEGKSENICQSERQVLIYHYTDLINYFERCLEEVSK